MIFCRDNRFDCDLKDGQDAERWLSMLGKLGRVEVKRERDMWFSTGNLFFEYKSRGKDSGYKVTQADYWATVLTCGESYCGCFIFDVPTLKRNLRRLFELGIAKVKHGGDDGTSRGLVVPISKVHELYV